MVLNVHPSSLGSHRLNSNWIRMLHLTARICFVHWGRVQGACKLPEASRGRLLARLILDSNCCWVEGPGQDAVALDPRTSRRGEAEGHLLRQQPLHVRARADDVRGREGGVVVEAQREGERVRGAVELDVRGHLPHETEVRQRWAAAAGGTSPAPCWTCCSWSSRSSSQMIPPSAPRRFAAAGRLRWRSTGQRNRSRNRSTKHGGTTNARWGKEAPGGEEILSLMTPSIDRWSL